MTEEQEREEFEEVAFGKYFLACISFTPNKQFADCTAKPKDEWMKRNPDGSYVEDSLNVAFWGWKEGRAALLKATENLVKYPTWRPINTAPKDNKRALYLARFNEEGELVELDFNGSWEYWEESWELSHINGWYWASNNGIEEPTHWAYQDELLPLKLDK